MEYSAADTKEKDHCRIGSLENYQGGFLAVENDHCRIGSLEILVHICD